MDFNGGSDLEQALTENGEKWCNVQFFKLQKGGLQNLPKTRK